MSSASTEFYARRSLARRVREHMRDHAELNTLVDGQESSDAMIEHAIDVLVEVVNQRPPPLGLLGVAAIPLDLSIDFCTSWLLDSVAILMVRNDLQFTAGGLTVAMDQYRTYLQIAAARRDRFDRGLREWKASVNLSQAVDGAGGVLSDWYAVNASRYYFQDMLPAAA